MGNESAVAGQLGRPPTLAASQRAYIASGMPASKTSQPTNRSTNQQFLNILLGILHLGLLLTLDTFLAQDRFRRVFDAGSF